MGMQNGKFVDPYDEVESLRQQLVERDKQIAVLRELDARSGKSVWGEMKTLYAQIVMLRAALGYVQKAEYYDDPTPTEVAVKALSATSDSDEWLRKHDAELVRKLALSVRLHHDCTNYADSVLNDIADQIERGEWK